MPGSLARQRRRPDRIVVVDNASTDDSLEQASELLKDVKLIRLPDNVGFATANNIGAQAAQGCEALALLNPDAFAEPGWLEALVAAAEREPAVAAFASQMRLANSPDYLDGSGDSYHVSGRAWRNGHGDPSRQGPRLTSMFLPRAPRQPYTGGKRSKRLRASTSGISAISRTSIWASASGCEAIGAATFMTRSSTMSAPL